MQMARRMLDVFERNDAYEKVGDLLREKTATLAAALLHDVGHGPYSHVFEELCDDLGIAKTHETYTRELIEIPPVGDLLKKFGVFNETRRFFIKEPGYSVFNAIISSQLDCDRLDFLCRDRHHTGIRSAAIDLAWLFDSLRIEKVPIDDEGEVSEYSFVFTAKGLAVAEEFVIAYMKMYHNVYFHKTTRGIQHLVKDFLRFILEERRDETSLRNLPMIRFFRNGGDLSDYAALDDSAILFVAHIAADSDWGLATDLARRFFCRDTYKCFEVPSTSSGNIGRQKLKRFREALQNENIYYIEDILSHRSYKQHAVTDSDFLKNILIKVEGEIESLGNVSLLLKEPAPRVARVYFRNEADKGRAQMIFRAL